MNELILDLTVDPDKSPLVYRKIKYPDGQQDIVLELNALQHLSYENNFAHRPFLIKSRLNNFLDLELIVCATAALRRNWVKNIQLYVPYIMGARSDRRFEIGGNNYLKDVLGPILNAQKFDYIMCMDPHSYVLENVINNLIFKDLSHFYNDSYKQILNQNNFKIPVLVTPDAGAEKRVFKAAQLINHQGDIITCSKHRALHGGITKTVVPETNEEKDHVIIDDICDGGATFIGIAKALRAKEVKGKLFLIVTHGIFSKGLLELSKYFDTVYTTNSVQNIEPESYSDYTVHTNFIKQFNIFK